MKIDGRCHCGGITYQAEVDPDGVIICHCTDCQTLTGSAFRATIPASAQSFALTSGAPSIYLKTAASGAQRAHAFCPHCGAPIYAAAPINPQTYSLRVGAIAQRAALRPSRQIWTRSALPWVFELGAAPGSPEQ